MDPKGTSRPTSCWQSLLSLNFDPATSEKRHADMLFESIYPPAKKVRLEEESWPVQKNCQDATIMPFLRPTPSSGTRVFTESDDDITRFPDIGLSNKTRLPVKRKCEDGIGDIQASKQPKLKFDIGDTGNGVLSQYCDEPLCTKEKLDSMKRIDVFLPQSWNSGSIERLEALMKDEVEIMNRMVTYAQSPQPLLMPKDFISDVLKLSDNSFHQLMRSFAVEMGCDNLIALIESIVEGVHAGEQNNSKIQAIIQYGLEPQLAKNELVRKLYPSYKKLLQVDENAIINHLLIPMILHRGLIVNALYVEINRHKLFERMLSHLMKDRSIPLIPHVFTGLNFCLERETQLSRSSLEALFDIIRRASGHQMSTGVSSFYFRLMKRFVPSMTEVELRQMHSLNTNNSYIGADIIEKMVEERLAILNSDPSCVPTTPVQKYEVCLWNPNPTLVSDNNQWNSRNMQPEIIDVDMDEDE